MLPGYVKQKKMTYQNQSQSSQHNLYELNVDLNKYENKYRDQISENSSDL